jgi:L-lactate dehydrogenase complex protein LldG
MSSREAILQRIRSRLSGTPPLAAPPVAEVWPRQTSDKGVLADQFMAELQAVFGEPIRCRSMAEAQQHLARLMETAPWPVLGAVESPAARELVAAVPAARISWVDAQWNPRRIAGLPAALVTAEVLLADTGTCLIACGTTQQRLMCYLPPAGVVIARTAQLAEHLPAAWADLARRCGDPALRGEFVLVTGPSRTADIEKVLILGVHGPKRLVVLLVD